MYVIRLMSRCDCACRFCLVWDEIKASKDLPLADVKQAIDQLDASEPIDFFGGEPTLYPHFLELASYARGRGHTITLASHCMRAADGDYARAMVDTGFSEIRTSLYGPNAEIHEYITRHPASFSKTLAGIENLRSLGQAVTTTFVITSLSVPHLAEMTRVVASRGCKSIKFGLLIQTDKNRNLTPKLPDVKAALAEATIACEQLGIQYAFAKMPFCLAPDHVNRFVCEGEYEGAPGVARIPGCERCSLASWCYGVEDEYLVEGSVEALAPFSSIPDNCVSDVNWTNVRALKLHEGPRLNLFRVDATDKKLLEELLGSVHVLKPEAMRREAMFGLVLRKPAASEEQNLLSGVGD